MSCKDNSKRFYGNFVFLCGAVFFAANLLNTEKNLNTWVCFLLFDYVLRFISNMDSHSDQDTDIEEPRVPLHPDPDLVDNDSNKKYKFGIVYLSYVPVGLNVKLLKEIFSEFGEVGRVYLKLEQSSKKLRTYSEGWVEFKKKRVAKQVAKTLNGTPLQYGRKRGKMNGQIWSIKYLHRFKWAHLTEQLAHDRAVKEQKRQFEMGQAKKQVEFYQKMVERSKYMKKTNRNKPQELDSDKMETIKKRQCKPIDSGAELNVQVDDDFLASIFKKVS